LRALGRQSAQRGLRDPRRAGQRRPEQQGGRRPPPHARQRERAARMSVRVQPAVAGRDRRDDLRVFLVTAGALLLTFAIGSTVQAVFVFRPERLTADQLLEQNPLLPARLTA